MREYPISEKKQVLINEFLSNSMQIGDTLYLHRKNSIKKDYATVLSLNPLKVNISDDGIKEITMDQIDSRITRKVGSDPFDKSDNNVRDCSYTLDSILFNYDVLGDKNRAVYEMNGITVGELNWNPWITLPNGTKKYYQRDFVWNDSDNKLLIESVYQNVFCGKIIIRNRDWASLEALAKTGETELFFNDVVDGKQRLNAVKLFLQDKFTDLHGNYFSDLSEQAQRKFGDHQLFSFGIIERATDEQVIRQFFKMNHLGVPQSREHIEYVMSLNKSFSKEAV